MGDCNPPQPGATALDFSLHALAHGRGVNLGPSVAEVLAWPVDDTCDGLKGTPQGRIVLRQWRKAERQRKERFPGLILSYTARERLKAVGYAIGRGREKESRLLDMALGALLVGRSHWSREVLEGATRLQFAEWIPGYFEDVETGPLFFRRIRACCYWPRLFWADLRRLLRSSRVAPGAAMPDFSFDDQSITFPEDGATFAFDCKAVTFTDGEVVRLDAMPVKPVEVRRALASRLDDYLRRIEADIADLAERVGALANVLALLTPKAEEVRRYVKLLPFTPELRELGDHFNSLIENYCAAIDRFQADLRRLHGEHAYVREAKRHLNDRRLA